jgi:phospholipid transport system substrate-binding protein
MKSIIPALLLILLALTARPAFADGTPATPVTALCDRLIEVMKQGDELGFEGREKRLRPVVIAAYDMAALTKSTLGLAGNKLTQEEADKLAEAYGRFSVATYADQFRHWAGEHFEISEPHSAPNGGGTIVPTFIVGGDGNRTAIDYLVHEAEGGWRIVDVLFKGSVSQVAVRRSEFVPYLRQNGFDALVAMLDGKTQALEKK